MTQLLYGFIDSCSCAFAGLSQHIHLIACILVLYRYYLLISLQNEARKLNHQEVVEEDKRLKLPTNWEAKKARLEWELAENEKKEVSFWLLQFLLVLKTVFILISKKGNLF